jgi:hypothetical protein
MKQKIFEIALQTGGSHYPNTGGVLLEQFADLLIAECVRVIQNTRLQAATTYDLELIEGTVKQIVSELEENFK